MNYTDARAVKGLRTDNYSSEERHAPEDKLRHTGCTISVTQHVTSLFEDHPARLENCTNLHAEVLHELVVS